MQTGPSVVEVVARTALATVAGTSPPRGALLTRGERSGPAADARGPGSERAPDSKGMAGRGLKSSQSMSSARSGKKNQRAT